MIETSIRLHERVRRSFVEHDDENCSDVVHEMDCEDTVEKQHDAMHNEYIVMMGVLEPNSKKYRVFGPNP